MSVWISAGLHYAVIPLPPQDMIIKPLDFFRCFVMLAWTQPAYFMFFFLWGRGNAMFVLICTVLHYRINLSPARNRPSPNFSTSPSFYCTATSSGKHNICVSPSDRLSAQTSTVSERLRRVAIGIQSLHDTTSIFFPGTSIFPSHQQKPSIAND